MSFDCTDCLVSFNVVAVFVVLSLSASEDLFGLSDFVRSCFDVPMIVLRSPHFFVPLSSKSDSLSVELFDIGRRSDGDMLPRARFFFMFGRGDKTPSKDMNIPRAWETVGSVRTINKRRPGAGLQGAVEGTSTGELCAASRRYT